MDIQPPNKDASIKMGEAQRDLEFIRMLRNFPPFRDFFMPLIVKRREELTIQVMETDNVEANEREIMRRSANEYAFIFGGPQTSFKRSLLDREEAKCIATIQMYEREGVESEPSPSVQTANG